MMQEVEIKKGDLVHIPQGVILWSKTGMKITERPRTAIFMGKRRAKCEAESYLVREEYPPIIFLDGKEYGVRYDRIYLLNKQERKLNVG